MLVAPAFWMANNLFMVKNEPAFAQNAKAGYLLFLSKHRNGYL